MGKPTYILGELQGDDSTSTQEGVVFTPATHAEVMVREAFLYRLQADIPSLDRAAFNIFFNGTAPRDGGQALARGLRDYTYLDPAVGRGIFPATISRLLRRLAGWYDLNIPDDWERTHITGWDIDPRMIAFCRRELPRPPRLIAGDFLSRTHTPPPDIIVANPPYIRQEKLPRDYKNRLHQKARDCWPALNVSARSDLYIYFLLQAAAVLAPRGVLTFIIPNGWMDSAYGAALRKLFLRHLTLCSILDSDRRHFTEDVNTVIVTAVSRAGDNTPLRPIHLALPPWQDKQWKVEQKRLAALPAGTGWYGSLFRCPPWLLEELQTNKTVVPLSSRFKVLAGIITGNNRRYYRSTPDGPDLLPAVRSPQETRSILFRRDDARTWLQVRDIPFRLRRAPLLWVDLRGGRHLVVWNRERLPFEHTFYGLEPTDDTPLEKLALVLNSSWVWLMVEVFGRRSLGGGAVRLVKRDLEPLPLPDPRRVEFPTRPGGLQAMLHRSIENWRTELTQPDRRELDRHVFQALGLWDRYDECLNLLRSLMRQREEKARS
jgi:hypothetical protein